MSGGVEKKARKSVRFVALTSFALKENAPIRKRVSFSKRIEIQDFDSLTNERYSAIQISTSGSSSSKVSGASHFSPWSRSSAPTIDHTSTGQHSFDEDVDMDVSCIHSANSPQSVTSDTMDVSMCISKTIETVDGQPGLELEPPIGVIPDVSMDCDAGNGVDVSVDMEAESIISEDTIRLDSTEHSALITEPADSHSTEPVTSSPVGVSLSPEADGLGVESADPCLSFEKSLFVAKGRKSVSTRDWDEEQAAKLDAQNPSRFQSPESFLSDPLEGLNQIRPAQVSFGGLGSATRSPRRPTGSLFTPLTPLLSTSMRTPSMHVLPLEEFSITGVGKRDLSIARDKRITEPLLLNLEFIRTTSTHSFNQLKVKPPVVVRQRVTVEEFIYDLLELDVSTVIKMSCFESVLEKVLPIDSWKAGKLDPIAEKYLQNFVDDLVTSNGLLANSRTVAYKSRMGQSVDLTLTEKTKSTDFWSEFLMEFNESSVDQKIQRINSLKDLFYDQICATAVKRAVSSLLSPLENLERQLEEKVTALEKEVQAKLNEMEKLQAELDGWSDILDNEAVFIAIAKARENIEETMAGTAEVLKERKELRLQLEALECSKVVKEHQEASFHRHLPTSYYVGRGASLFPFGPPVPQSRLVEVCHSLFSTSQVISFSAEANIYHINTLLGLILVEVHCKSRQQCDTWSASNEEILNLRICTQKDLAQLDAINEVAAFAVDCMKQNWALLTNCLVGRTLEDAVDFLEYSLQSYALLMVFLRALFFADVSVELELPNVELEYSFPAIDQAHPTKAWRFCQSFYTVAKAVSLDTVLSLKPLRLIGIIAPMGVNAVLRTVSNVSSTSDLLSAEAISSISLEDPIGNIRLECLRHLSSDVAPHAPDNFVTFHERLVASIPQTVITEVDENGE
ncbi:hypothetical protein TcWFU_006427 [Taenia crassiceps]|uniref:Spc7 kinetochore protein domain-containing protein n=1 Tax=Taenia crassiceps TaxID=6207 RepID=A0ABR4PZZ4_9CEST